MSNWYIFSFSILVKSPCLKGDFIIFITVSNYVEIITVLMVLASHTCICVSMCICKGSVCLFKEKYFLETSWQSSQWLRLCAFNSGDAGSVPGQGNKIPHAAQCSQRRKILSYKHIYRSGFLVSDCLFCSIF